jgi:hypothetical protein
MGIIYCMKNQSLLDLEQSIHYIKSIDFTAILDKLRNQMGWQESHALETCDMYRKFLILQRKYGHMYNLPPSEDMDEFWHMHILDTKAYRKDCDVIFGHYLDHYPYLGIDATSNLKDLENAFSKTQELYALEFGGQEIFEVRGFWAKMWTFFRVSFATRPKRVGLTNS